MNREELIKAIYKKIADKTLNEWCLVELWEWEIIKINRVNKIATLDKIYHFMYSDFTNSNSYLKETEFPNMNIIWHPVMIWDVLDYENINWKYVDLLWRPKGYQVICDKWEHKKKPIEEQSDDCIDYIYNLIKEIWKKIE